MKTLLLLLACVSGLSANPLVILSGNGPNTPAAPPAGIPVTSGLMVHLESLSHTAANDDPVDAWVDQSGNGFNATGTSTSRPLYKADAGYGVPGIKFDGSNDFLTFGNPGGFAITNTVTAFFLTSRTAATTAVRQSILGHSDAANAFQMELEGRTQNTFVQGTFITETTPTPVYADFQDNQPFLTTYRRTGAGAGTHSTRGNGLPLEESTNGSGSYSGNATKDLGRRTAGINHLNGYMFAVVIYNRALSDAEVRQVEDYLGSRYQSHLGNPFWFELQNQATIAAGSSYIQGIAFDGTNYWTTTDRVTDPSLLKRWSRSGDTYTLLNTYDVTSVLPAGAEQINGIQYYDGSLWIGCNNYPTTPEKGWMLQYNLTGGLLATHATEDHWSEGGAWRRIGGVDQFFTIYHDTLNVSAYDTSWALQSSYTRPDHSRPVTNNNISQGAAWLDNWFFTPNHDNGDEDKLDVHLWTGSGFAAGYRISTPLTDATHPVADMSQGICWDIPPGTEPVLGNDMLFARRFDTGRIVRATLRRRWGYKGF